MTQTVTSLERVNALVDQLLRELDPAQVSIQEFNGRQFDLGLAWVHFPEGRGGLGLEPALQAVIDQRLAAAGATDIIWLNGLGYGMGGPTLLAWGSDELIDRHLRPIFTAEEVWCQLFSEPGSGSDLASLSTRAVREGDEWIINGQKVWTTLGHFAKWGMLLARTDPDQVKHKGLTFFLLDMEQPGVDVRPLVQMTGDAEFNEVYLTDARVPDSRRLGGVGEGWRVALTTLMNERVMLGGAAPPRNGGPIGDALHIWRQRDLNAPVLRDELVHWWVQAEVLRLTQVRAGQTRTADTPGPDGSIGKLLNAELNKKLWSFNTSLLGMDATLLPETYVMGRSSLEEMHSRGPQWQFLRAFANSIEGGTTEIMRNILAERVLGLPGDVRVDKDKAWSRVPRS